MGSKAIHKKPDPKSPALMRITSSPGDYPSASVALQQSPLPFHLHHNVNRIQD